jgi:glutathione S-transferase
MLELYHHGSSVCAAKVRFALEEKGLAWDGHYLDILKGDQFSDAYRALNPKAVVPTLVHDGRVVVESTVIAEYLDDVFPEQPLRPADAYGRAAMRLWTKAVDEDVHPACAEVTFVSCHRHIIGRLPPADLQKFLASTPPQSVTPTWHARKKALVEGGFAVPGVADKFRLYDRYLQKMEDALAQAPWLAGERFSLADVGMAPYVNRLDMLGMSEMWTRDRPRVTDWFERLRARATFKVAFLDWCPPDLTNDLLTFGRRSWPEVRALLAA